MLELCHNEGPLQTREVFRDHVIGEIAPHGRSQVVMTSREIEEYRALRDTIRERSTARLWIALTGVSAWAALMLATATFIELPVATLVPLLVLALTFEIVSGIHTAVERVGRYVHVFLEAPSNDRGWEHQVMEYGRRFAGGGTDPLFCSTFWAAAVLNLLPAAIVTPSPGALEWTVVGSAHAGFAVRVLNARRRAARQRALDLERFTQLRSGQ